MFLEVENTFLRIDRSVPRGRDDRSGLIKAALNMFSIKVMGLPRLPPAGTNRHQLPKVLYPLSFIYELLCCFKVFFQKYGVF